MEIPSCHLGDKVLLKKNKTKKGKSRKLTAKHKGPYIIVTYGPHYTYKLKCVSDNVVTPNFWHNDNLKPFYTRATNTDHEERDQGSSPAPSYPPTHTHNKLEKMQKQDNANKPTK